MKKKISSQYHLHEALKLSFPVLLGYIPLGAAFGVLLVKAGYPWFLAPVMSLIIYAGAGQMLAVNFFVMNSSYAEVALATLLLHVRHSFYGLSLVKYFS